jgi:hypothetical protein
MLMNVFKLRTGKYRKHFQVHGREGRNGLFTRFKKGKITLRLKVKMDHL